MRPIGKVNTLYAFLLAVALVFFGGCIRSGEDTTEEAQFHPPTAVSIPDLPESLKADEAIHREFFVLRTLLLEAEKLSAHPMDAADEIIRNKQAGVNGEIASRLSSLAQSMPSLATEAREDAIQTLSAFSVSAEALRAKSKH